MAVATAMPRAVGELHGLAFYAWAFSGYVVASLFAMVVAGGAVRRARSARPPARRGGPVHRRPDPRGHRRGHGRLRPRQGPAGARRRCGHRGHLRGRRAGVRREPAAPRVRGDVERLGAPVDRGTGRRRVRLGPVLLAVGVPRRLRARDPGDPGDVAGPAAPGGRPAGDQGGAQARGTDDGGRGGLPAVRGQRLDLLGAGLAAAGLGCSCRACRDCCRRARCASRAGCPR
jgi:hypothetical protein